MPDSSNAPAPLVSVLMTVYNREKYIAEAIESVMKSTVTDWELVIVDDQSKDRSVEIARGYAAADPRIRVYVNEKNLGDYPNRNRAAQLARGTYLKYLDSDDMIYPHGLQVMVDAMERFPEAGFALCANPGRVVQRFPLLLTPAEAYEGYFLGDGDYFDRSPLSAILRASAFRESGGYTGTRYIGDFEFWTMMAARWPLVAIPPHLGFWRAHGEQESTYGEQPLEYPRLRYAAAMKALTSDICPLPPEKRDEAARRARRRHARVILRMAMTGHAGDARRLARETGFRWDQVLAAAWSQSERKSSNE